MDHLKKKVGYAHYGVTNSPACVWGVWGWGQGLEELILELRPKECLGSSLELGRKDKEIRSGFV